MSVTAQSRNGRALAGATRLPAEGLKVRRIKNHDGSTQWSVSRDGIWLATLDAEDRQDALRQAERL